MVCCGQALPDTQTIPPPPIGACCLRTRYVCENDTWVLDMGLTACVDNAECGAGVSCSDEEFVSEVIDGCVCAAPLPALPVPTCDPHCSTSGTTSSTSSTSTSTAPPFACGSDPLWTTSATGGGSFSSATVTELTFNFADSINCGGLNNSLQTGMACTTVDGETGNKSVRINGQIQEQDAGFDCISVYIDDVFQWQICSENNDGGCNMVSAGIDISIPSGPNHKIEVEISSLGGLYHASAFWSVFIVNND